MAVNTCALGGQGALRKRQSGCLIGEEALAAQPLSSRACRQPCHHANSVPRLFRSCAKIHRRLCFRGHPLKVVAALLHSWHCAGLVSVQYKCGGRTAAMRCNKTLFALATFYASKQGCFPPTCGCSWPIRDRDRSVVHQVLRSSRSFKNTVRWSGFSGKSGKASRNFAITVGLSRRKNVLTCLSTSSVDT